MFNQAGFNELSFNALYGVDVYASFAIDHTLDSIINLSMTYSLQFNIEHELSESTDALRDRVGAFLMDLAHELAFSGVRDRIAQFDMDCRLDMSFDGTRYRIESIEYTGDFAPGDKIVFDTDKLKFTQNGQNALHLMQGDFFNLNSGLNNLEYTDDQTGRTVRIRLTHEDRYIG